MLQRFKPKPYMPTNVAVSPSKNGSTQRTTDAPMTSVYMTREYEKFKPLHGNRIINLAHVKRLTESFQLNHLVCPIIVNDNYEIIDGQHRWMVCKELSLPIHYIVIKNYGLKEVQIFNSNSSVWNKKDYLESYCQLGLRQYLEFKRFASMFPEFPITVCGSLLSDKSSVNGSGKASSEGRFAKKEFEEGKFQIKDFERATKFGRRIMDFAPHYKGYNKPSFVRAMVTIFKSKNYSHDIMIKKLKTPGNERIQDQASVTAYQIMIENIFNYKNRNKVSLRYGK